jgi:hypothetical protein
MQKGEKKLTILECLGGCKLSHHSRLKPCNHFLTPIKIEEQKLDGITGWLRDKESPIRQKTANRKPSATRQPAELRARGELNELSLWD